MRALHRKLLRDLWHMRGQALAISLVISCGVATFVMSLSMHGSLKRTLDAYYGRYRFGQVFAHLKRAPDTLLPRIADIPGVAQVQTRVVESVTLDVPGMKEPAIGRLISIPERARPVLNDTYLRSGRYIEPGRTGEVLANENFVKAHNLKPGDSITAIINGHKEKLKIVGVALSPEYIFQIRPGDVLPDKERFGVFWMGHKDLAAAFDMEGAFNDIALTLMPGASEADVIRRLDRLLETYGGLGAYSREDQVSHKFVTNEINELRGMALISPSIFLSVAAFLLNVVLSRIINAQREQIAALKAFGYSNLEVGWHYIELVLMIVVVGVLLGSVFGVWLGHGLTIMYLRFFQLPVIQFDFQLHVIGLAWIISSSAAILGTLGSVRRAVSLPPAEAMRPEPPANYKPTVIERLGFQRFVSPQVRMILRNLERKPINALLSMATIALAVAVLVLGNFMVDALEYVMDSNFRFAQRQDMSVTFVEAASSSVLSDIMHLPGVVACEPFRSVTCRIRSSHHSRRLAIQGVEPHAELYRVMNVHRQEIPLPPDGLVLSEILAKILDVKPGDMVTVEVFEGDRPTRAVQVAALLDDFAGTTAYMDIAAVRRLMREGRTVSGAHLRVDGKYHDALYAELKNTPRVAGVSIKGAALQSFRETVAENLLRMKFFNVLFATIIAIGVVYNSARISLAERSRELATLRVIGFTRAEISLILLGELAILTLGAIPFGLVMGYFFSGLVVHAVESEMFRIPLIVNRSTYALAATVVLTAATASGLVVRRMLDRLDLVAVLKTKE